MHWGRERHDFELIKLTVVILPYCFTFEMYKMPLYAMHSHNTTELK